MEARSLSHDDLQHVITTDASLSGWRAKYKEMSSGGMWTELEATNHINYLEILAILFGLQTFAKNMNSTDIRIMCDNTSAVNIINHIPGKQNLVADFESRRSEKASEWMLNKDLLSDAFAKLDLYKK